MKPWQIVALAAGIGCALLFLFVAAGAAVGGLLFWRAQRSAAGGVAQAPDVPVTTPPGDHPSWQDWLKANDLGRCVPAGRSLARPAVRLTIRAAAVALDVGQSRVGGEPDLPADFPWPAWRDQPLAFLAQLNLGEVPAAARDSLGVPAAGWLLFFEAAEPGEAGRGSYRVAHVPGGTPLARRPLPPGLPAEARFKPCTVAFTVGEDLPDSGEEALAALNLDDAEDERYVAVRAAMAGAPPIHKLGGHPDLIQGAMADECRTAGGPGDWVLLFQLDSDDAAGMMWGDAGRLYYWLRQADLAAGQFDRTYRTSQCY